MYECYAGGRGISEAYLVIGGWDPIKHLEAVQGGLAPLGLVGQHACEQRYRQQPCSVELTRTPTKAHRWVASDGSACGVISWL